MIKSILLQSKVLVLFLSIVPFLSISQITLLTDFNNKPKSTNSIHFVKASNITYFVANTSGSDALWRTDGTTEGTILLTTGNTINDALNPGRYSLSNDTLYFFNRGYFGEQGLWRTDGTIKGTKKICYADYYSPILNINGIIYFAGSDSLHGKELWRTDGTAKGTYMFKDLRPGLESSSPNVFINCNGLLIFTCLDQNIKNGIWRSDLTDTGTWLLKTMDIYISGSTSYNENICVFNNNVYFDGIDKAHGYELWKTDGTVSGTMLVKDINSGEENAYPSYFKSNENYLFFIANDNIHGNSLWRTNGTADGTVLVLDFKLTAGSWESTLVNGILYYYVNQEGHSSIWKTDGTLNGSSIIKEFNYPDSRFYIKFLCDVNGILYFNGYDELHGNGIWKSDGTTQGTAFEKGIITGKNAASPDCLNSSNGKLYLKMYDSNYNDDDIWSYEISNGNLTRLKDFEYCGDYYDIASITNSGWYIFNAEDSIAGNELWGTDGTPEGTIMIKDLSPGDGGNYFSDIDIWKNDLYFSIDEYEKGYKLYKTNGMPSGMKLVKTISDRDNVIFECLYSADHLMFFTLSDEINGTELWITDGTDTGTKLLKLIYKDKTYMGLYSPVYLNGWLYFIAQDQADVNNMALWKSDGTSDGTIKVRSFMSAYGICAFGNRIAFSADDGDDGGELWISDGSTAGTYKVKDICPGICGSVSSLCSFKDKLFFGASDDWHGPDPWISDGTSSGTYLIKELIPDYYSKEMSNAVVFKDKVFFIVEWSDGFTFDSIALYSTDGTEEGTKLIKAFYYQLYNGGRLIVLDSFMLFMINGHDSFEIWRSNGTATGTFIIKKGAHEMGNPSLDGGIILNDKIYFDLVDPLSGEELWCSDGTEEGTYLVGEINPGISSSYPYNFKTNGKDIFFIATSDYYGKQIYKYTPSPAPTTQSYEIEFYDIRSKQFSVCWVKGNGEKSVAFIKKGNTGAAIVSDGTNYKPSNTYQLGDRSDDQQWFCIYNGYGNDVTVEGLQSATEYRVMVVEYNLDQGKEIYNPTISSQNPDNQYTLINQTNSEFKDISVYPNPTKGELLILNSADSRILLYNSQGKLVYELISNSEPKFIDLSLYPNGLYFFSFISNNTIKTKKVILYKQAN